MYGFVSTTEINASASASFNKQWGSGTSKSEQRQINITTVPNSISNVAFTKKTGDFTQKATFFCSFDASVTINAGPGHAEKLSVIQLKILELLCKGLVILQELMVTL